MNVLGIETSCDETAVAIYNSEQGLLAHQLYSQIPLHAEYGGVVPELASRDHIRKILPLITGTLAEAELEKHDLGGIAYTKGPGLVGALMVGATVGRSLAWGLGIPAVGVHHMEAHLLAAMLDDPAPEYPFIALIVSGGHTMLVKVERWGSYELLGETLDDAAGEAFDKTAKLLGLPYPGGPQLSALAERGDPHHFKFPRPMTDRPGLDFSFSGLKTFASNCYRQNIDDDNIKANIASAFQDAVVDTLTIKAKRALDATHLTRLVVVGGVSANKNLRAHLAKVMQERNGEVFYPRPEFCTDNGAMVAYAGFLRLQAGYQEDLSVMVKTRWPMDDGESGGL